MRFHLEATPAELWQKGTALIEELVKAFAQTNPSLSEVLEKALPPKEQNLKYPMLRGLKDVTSKEYDAMTKRMLADIGKVLDQSVKAPGGVLAKAFGEPEEKDPGAEEEEKLEPGDVDPETGDLIPEEDEEEEEGEGEEGEEKSLEKAAPGGVERTYKVRGHPEVIDQLDALLLIANKLGSWGASRSVTISMDGDGPHFLEVEGTEGELEKQALENLIEKDEIKAYHVGLKKSLGDELQKIQEDWERVKADFDKHTHPTPSFEVHRTIEKADLPQSDPLDHDFTKPIAEKDGLAYARVKRVLMGRGYTEGDFEEGGTLYGYSVNELIDLAREERKASQNGST